MNMRIFSRGPLFAESLFVYLSIVLHDNGITLSFATFLFLNLVSFCCGQSISRF